MRSFAIILFVVFINDTFFFIKNELKSSKTSKVKTINKKMSLGKM